MYLEVRNEYMSRIEGIDYDYETTKIKEQIALDQELYVQEHTDLTGTEECDS